jgi:sulfite reductase alpha subunit-like flavoprotein
MPLLVRAVSLAERAVRGLRRVYHGAGRPPGFHEGLEILIISICLGCLLCRISRQGFWKYLLRKYLGAQWLKGVRHAVFGLGDSGYQKYNVRLLSE